MPDGLRRRAVRNLGGEQDLGLNFRRTHYVETAIGIGIWVVRGNLVACIFQARHAAAACAPERQIANNGLSLVVGHADGSRYNMPTHFFAIGIAPNDITAVKLMPLGGQTKVVPVIDNAYGLRADTPIRVQQLIR
jgi:hypothetical protein